MTTGAPQCCHHRSGFASVQIWGFRPDLRGHGDVLETQLNILSGLRFCSQEEVGCDERRSGSPVIRYPCSCQAGKFMATYLLYTCVMQSVHGIGSYAPYVDAVVDGISGKRTNLLVSTLTTRPQTKGSGGDHEASQKTATARLDTANQKLHLAHIGIRRTKCNMGCDTIKPLMKRLQCDVGVCPYFIVRTPYLFRSTLRTSD